MDKWTWEDGDIEVVKLMYNGKEVTKEELKRIEEEEENGKVRK